MQEDFKYIAYSLIHPEDADTQMSVTKVLGINDDFEKKVISSFRKAMSENDHLSFAWEAALNEILPKTAAEAFFVGWAARCLCEKG